MASLLRRSSVTDVEVPGPAAKIAAVQTSVDVLAGEQVAYIESLADKATRKRDRIASVLARIGHPIPGAKVAGNGVGGPFIPLAANADPETFRTGAALVAAEIDDLAAARRAAGRLPLSRPIASAPVTSGFGARLDPFLGRPAMHTGIDFRAAVGYPIRTTAAGTVSRAGYAGGYGLMVEIDHGDGLSTRYAHMSRISVSPGEVVPKGAIVGRAGSTGRSTGPHIHYEIRVDGEAIDPMRYIRAGGEIAAAL